MNARSVVARADRRCGVGGGHGRRARGGRDAGRQPAGAWTRGRPDVAAGGSTSRRRRAGYAGSDTCVDVPRATRQTRSKARSTGRRRTRARRRRTHGCESCHGPGQAHVDDDAKGHILKFGQMKPAEVNQTCLTCHNRGNHAGWEGSAHERRNLSCTTCHSVHSPKSAEHQLVKATETAVCATCHRLQVAKTERAVAHMPVREGKMSCTPATTRTARSATSRI